MVLLGGSAASASHALLYNLTSGQSSRWGLDRLNSSLRFLCHVSDWKTCLCLDLVSMVAVSWETRHGPGCSLQEASTLNPYWPMLRWSIVNKSNESYTGLKTVILGVWLGHRSLASSWQPHFSQVSQRVAYIQTYIFHISAMLSRQGLLLVENVDGALALGGIDQQYQVGRVIVRTHVCILRLINYLLLELMSAF